jgi:hypothetical protein
LTLIVVTRDAEFFTLQLKLQKLDVARERFGDVTAARQRRFQRMAPDLLKKLRVSQVAHDDFSLISGGR